MYSAAKIADCDPKTVRRYVEARNAGRPVAGPVRRARLTDAQLAKIEEWVERSQGHISARRAHEWLVSLGYSGSERTTRRAVAEAKERRRHPGNAAPRPWIAEPGLWAQFEWTGGPPVAGPDGVPRPGVGRPRPAGRRRLPVHHGLIAG
ncbi:hypothetical protein [Streptomyces litchfieldiae]|uniref:Transposase n=1 Tax=Streptomyces litchfieldiae TaxID=3075543 RepID=A0ABU2MS10_9ACTN|nr:hypothetical protein [Streptomyces sp. DSM 44938]MDT0344202.1 hypothetical protein [Streptomyces sp. DSM 44938]